MNQKGFPQRGRRVCILLLLAACVALGATAAVGAAPGAKPPVQPQPTQPPKADRDGNKIFDDLEAQVAAAPGERVDVLVALNVPATAERVADLRQRAGGLAVGRRFGIVDGFAASVTKGQLEALSHVPWVEHVEANARVTAFNDGAQAAFGVTKARVDVSSLDGDADGSAATYSKDDLVAAVIDTGIDASHVDLDGGKVLAFKDFVGGRTAAYDDNGHGTHVAATIAGDGDARADRAHRGVAPAAALVGVKVLDAAGGGTMENVTAAIEWVVQNKDAYGIEAINLSLGASGCSDGTDLTSRAANAAVAAGLAVFAAAGNDGPGQCTIGAPGAAADVVTVGAAADLAAGGFQLASFSSRGPTADGRIKPDLVGPGVDITSAQTGMSTGYVTYSGTSMATPFVAGVALLALDANRALTPSGLKAHLAGAAVEWGASGVDREYGAGRLDAYAALAAAGAPLSSPPDVPAHVAREGWLSGTGAVVDTKLDVWDLRYPIAATLIIRDLRAAAAYTPDFDLYLYGPKGELVGRAETVSRQETISFRPTATGTYTLRTSSYSGNGAFVLDVSAGLGSAPSPPPAPAPVAVTAAPGSVTLYSGSVSSGDVKRLGSDDDAYFAVKSTTWGTRVTDWYGRFTGVTNALRSLKVGFRGKSSTTCSNTVFLYNWTTGIWVALDTRNLGTTESGLTAAASGVLAESVSGTTGDGDVAVRVRCVRGDSVNFTTSTDQLQITYER